MIHLNIGIMLELKSIKLCCQTEYTVDSAVQFKIRTQSFVIESIFFGLEFIGVVGVIPRIDYHRLAFEFRSKFGQFLHLGLGRRSIGLAQTVEQVVHRLRSLGHGALQRVLRVCFAAKQIGYFTAYFAYLLYVLKV